MYTDFFSWFWLRTRQNHCCPNHCHFNSHSFWYDPSFLRSFLSLMFGHFAVLCQTVGSFSCIVLTLILFSLGKYSCISSASFSLFFFFPWNLEYWNFNFLFFYHHLFFFVQFWESSSPLSSKVSTEFIYLLTYFKLPFHFL